MSKGGTGAKADIKAARASHGAFASDALSAARHAPEFGFAGSGKVWIADAYHQYAKTAAGRGVSLDQFKERLASALHQRKLDLVRYDLHIAAEGEIGRQSTMHSHGAEFHFIRIKR
jgi:hypothetical protein